MPLYEYRCEQCGNTIEVIQKFSDVPLSECEACGGELERLLSPASVQFKGSGWYVTDYGRKNSASSESSSKAKKDSGDSGSKDSSGAVKGESSQGESSK